MAGDLLGRFRRGSSAGIPSREGQVFRDLGAAASALAVRGGGGSPKELRSDAGIFLQYPVGEILKRHTDLIDVDVIESSVAVAGANSTGSAAVSFDGDHFILGLNFQASANPANVVWIALTALPWGQSEISMIGYGLLADRITFTGISGADDYFPTVTPHLSALPLFGRAETDYRIWCRTGAGGGATALVSIYRVIAPDGVEIAH
jgi:hypothetical protein